MADKRRLTRSGYQALEDELRELIDVHRPDYKRQLAEARAEGDLSENADYDAARARQAEVEGRIKQIEEILKDAEIIDDTVTNTKKVALGLTVRLLNMKSSKEVEYKIVDTVEADPFNGLISQTCLLGSSIIGKTVGDIVEIKAIEPYSVKILEIKIK